MTRWNILAAFLIFFGTIMPAPLIAEDAPAIQFQAAMSQLVSQNGPGLVVLVSKQGQILFQQGFGLADVENKVPITPDTRFRIGSITKQFLAAAVLRLASENRLSIDDPLSNYFPDFPGSERIKIRQLLNHTSGVHNFLAHADFTKRVLQPISESALIDYFQNDPPDFEPGLEFSYSNSGYVLLGQIIEQVTGKSLGNYWEKTFFHPLGMVNTGVYVNTEVPEKSALGYALKAGAVTRAEDWNMSWTGGAGCLYSTADDLRRWTEALHGGRVLPPEALATMLSEANVAKKETLTRYAMGLYHSELGWLPIIAHNGALSGFSGLVTYFPNQETTIVVLGNCFPCNPELTPQKATSLAAHIFLKNEIASSAPQIDAAFDSKKFADLIGRYDYGSTYQEISLDKGHLYARLTGQPRFEIFPCGRDDFFYANVEARLSFYRDDGGVVIGLTHSQNGQSFNAARLKDIFVTLSPEQLDQIVGKYQYGPGAVLTVRRVEDQLYAQLTGQQEFPIFPSSDHAFYWKVLPASVQFMRGADGSIVRAIHTQNGTSFAAPRLKN